MEITVSTANGPRPFTLLDCYYILGFHTNCVLGDRLEAAGFFASPYTKTLIYKQTPFCNITKQYSNWVLEFNPTTMDSVDSAFVATNKHEATSIASSKTWHERYAHAGPEVIKRLEDNVRGVKLTDLNPPSTVNCNACGKSKATQIISRVPRHLAGRKLQRLHMDLLLVNDSKAYDGTTAILHIIDEATNMEWSYNLPSKDHTSPTLTKFVKMIQNQTYMKISTLVMDNEASITKEFLQFCDNNGIRWENTPVDTPHKNGKSERHGRMILDKARAIITHTNLPIKLWPEIIKAIVFICNSTPTAANNWKTPYELFHGRKPNRIATTVGSKGFILRKNYQMTKSLVNQGTHKLHKLEPKAYICYLVGYITDNIYNVWVPGLDRVATSSDVIFKEGEFYNPNDEELRNALLLKDLTHEEVVEQNHHIVFEAEDSLSQWTFEQDEYEFP